MENLPNEDKSSASIFQTSDNDSNAYRIEVNNDQNQTKWESLSNNDSNYYRFTSDDDDDAKGPITNNRRRSKWETVKEKLVKNSKTRRSMLRRVSQRITKSYLSNI